MKGKLTITALLCLLIVAFAGGMSAQAAEKQVGSVESLISESEEFANIAELVEAEEVEIEEPEVAASAEVTEVKWNDYYTKKDLMYLASIIYCEAGSMHREAKLGVANVIINRMNDHGAWGHVNTIKDVIYDHKWGTQFSPTKNGSMNAALKIYKNLDDYKGTWRYDNMVDCIKIAKQAFCGEKAIPDSYMSFNGNIASSKAKCKSAGKSYMVIEAHIYY